jgi:hypothetical protein
MFPAAGEPANANLETDLNTNLKTNSKTNVITNVIIPFAYFILAASLEVEPNLSGKERRK